MHDTGSESPSYFPEAAQAEGEDEYPHRDCGDGLNGWTSQWWSNHRQRVAQKTFRTHPSDSATVSDQVV